MPKIELIQGDCLEKMKDITDGSIDMILCDLPYGTTKCKWDVVIPFEPLWEQYNRIIKDRGVIVLFGSEPFSSLLRCSNLQIYKYDWIWYKNTTSGFVLAKKQPMRNHENISVFYKGQCDYYPIKELRDLNEDSKKRMQYEFTSTCGVNVQQGGIKKVQFIPEHKELAYPKTVKRFNSVPTSSGRLHPTQKPVVLLEYLIKTYTIEGETILDNCMGSGSTGVACKNINRNFIGIELDPEYFKIAKKRINENPENTIIGDRAI